MSEGFVLQWRWNIFWKSIIISTQCNVIHLFAYFDLILRYKKLGMTSLINISSKFLKIGSFPIFQIYLFIYKNQFKDNIGFSQDKKNSPKQSLAKIRIFLYKGFQFIACSLIYGFFECFECAIHFTLSTKGVLFCPYCLPFFDWSFSQWCQQKITLAQQFGTLIVFTNFYISPYFWAMV